MNAESVLSKPKDGYGFVRTAIKEYINPSEPMIGAFRGRNPENPSERGRSNGMYKQRLEINENGTSNTLTGVQKDNVILIPEATKEGYIPMEIGGVCDLSYPTSKTRRGRVQDGGTVAPTLTCGCEGALRRIEEPKIDVVAMLADTRKHEIARRIHSVNGLAPACHTCGGGGLEPKILEPIGYRIRKLTERECFRLMGVCEEYIDLIQAAGISRSQQYKIAGNSIVVDVLVAIFRQLLIGNKNAFQQLEIF
jgi:DNA (cytosine-5)-methyltransferase 1